ncbi:putative transferase [Helianthus annuus]|nr:putative transferase [Helianthus annuus]
MESNGGADESSRLLHELQSLKDSKRDIEARISVIEAQLQQIQSNQHSNNESPAVSSNGVSEFGHDLTPDMIYRYSRQLLLPSFGVQGQSNLLKSSILVIGAGGLGSPALLYLAACGVGKLGMVDHDVVELNNLHRQIIHGEAYIGKSKVESAAASLPINSTTEIVEHKEALRTSNAIEIVSKYDIVIDATDNAPSRYLISDCCVSTRKASCIGCCTGFWKDSLRFTITMVARVIDVCFLPHHLQQHVRECSDSGVLGVVPGVIGCLQALEAIKLASLVGEPLSGRMLLFDALSAKVRIVKIRGRSLQCEACGENGLTQQQFQQFDYEKFTQSPLAVRPLKLKLLTSDSRISSKEYDELIKKARHMC